MIRKTTIVEMARKPRFPARPGRLAVSLVCILLVISSIAIAFHHHADGAEHPDCALCIAAHTVAPNVIHVAPVPAPPADVVERLIAACDLVPCAIVRTSADPRAPPIA